MIMINDYLQKSAQLLKVLNENCDKEQRSAHIEQINRLLDERGMMVEQLKQEGFQYDATNRLHATLFELDKSISEKLQLLMENVKEDIKVLKSSKKGGRQYIDPYNALGNLDARYYDGKK